MKSMIQTLCVAGLFFASSSVEAATQKFVTFNVYQATSTGCSEAAVASMIFAFGNRVIPLGQGVTMSSNCAANTLSIGSAQGGGTISMGCQNYYPNNTQYLNFGFGCEDKDDANVWAYTLLNDCVSKTPLFTIFVELNVCTKDFYQAISGLTVTSSSRITRQVDTPSPGTDRLTYESFSASATCGGAATQSFQVDIPSGGNSSSCSSIAGSGASVLGSSAQIMTAGQYAAVYGSASSVAASFTVALVAAAAALFA